MAALTIGALIATAIAGAVAGGATGLANSAFNNWYGTEQDLRKMQTQYGYDTALSKQNHEQELARQMQSQEWQKMMADTEMQRKIADYKEAGVNPALAFGGVSQTNAQAGAQPSPQAPQMPPKTNARQQMNNNNIMAIANAYKAGIQKVALKSIFKRAEFLAKHPHNKHAQKNVKYHFKTYANLLKF